MLSRRVPASETLRRWSSSHIAVDACETPSFLRISADSSFDEADRQIPAFLRKQKDVGDRTNPLHWCVSAHHTGLTPLGLSEWSRLTPASEWPTSYIGLQQIGLGDWLELAMGDHI